MWCETVEELADVLSGDDRRVTVDELEVILKQFDAWGWLENADGPDDAMFSFEVVGFDEARAFVQGVTVYRANDDRPERTYDNLWVIDLTDDGRASAFTEWYIRRPT